MVTFHKPSLQKVAVVSTDTYTDEKKMRREIVRAMRVPFCWEAKPRQKAGGVAYSFILSTGIGNLNSRFCV